MAENTTPKAPPTIEELMAQLEEQRAANAEKDAELARMAEELDATASAKDLALPVFGYNKRKYRLNAPKFQLVGEDGPRTADDVRKDKELQKKLVELGGDLLTELKD